MIRVFRVHPRILRSIRGWRIIGELVRQDSGRLLM